MPDIYLDVDTALSEVPVNIMPLLDDTDFKTRETAIAYNAAGMDLVWNFVTSAGAFTQTAVTPTTAGNYDWTHQGDGMYTIEIPASGGASINNDTEGYGWFTGFVTGVLPWRGPIIGFRASAINDSLCDAGTTGLLSPTTAARTLDVTATGAAGIDWGNIENPTTAVNLSATNIDVDQVVASVSGAVGSVTGNVGGNVTGSVGSIASGGITTASFAAGAINAAAIAADAIGASELASDAITEIAAGVWDRDATLSQTQGTFGQAIGDPVADTNTIYKAVVTDATGATVGVDVVAIKAETVSIQADTDNIQTRLPAALVSGRMDASVGAMATDVITSTALAASAVTEIQSGLSTLTSANVSAAVWDAATASYGIAGSYGLLVETNLDATVSSRLATAGYTAPDNTSIAAILVDTAEIGVAGAGLTNINLPNQTMDIVGNITGNLSGSVGSVTGLTVAHIDAAISTRATPAQVNTEVVDALATDTYTEPTGAPGVTVSLKDKIGYIYMALRNKLTVTSSAKTFYDNGGAAEWSKTLSDDGSTYTEDEGV